ELAVDWYWEQDSIGNFIKFSGPVLDMMGIKTSSYQGVQESSSAIGWDNAQHAVLMGKIAARQAFLDFKLTRVNKDGTLQVFRVSGQPMFNELAAFIGYRGIGLEVL
ncbi:MAG: response regulator, partial [Pseudohongiella sp.]|nr:response regulator [Pseudohongiella sp.]